MKQVLPLAILLLVIGLICVHSSDDGCAAGFLECENEMGCYHEETGACDNYCDCDDCSDEDEYFADCDEYY